jgi:hypothetical protein
MRLMIRAVWRFSWRLYLSNFVMKHLYESV